MFQQSSLGSDKVGQSFSLLGLGGQRMLAVPTSVKQKAQEGEGGVEEPQDKTLPSPVECSV